MIRLAANTEARIFHHGKFVQTVASFNSTALLCLFMTINTKYEGFYPRNLYFWFYWNAPFEPAGHRDLNFMA